jgi:hypothetical protein
MTKNIYVRKTASDHVVKEPAMSNWSEMLRHAEDWADGFWAGAASASLMLMAGRYLGKLFSIAAVGCQAFLHPSSLIFAPITNASLGAPGSLPDLMRDLASL